MAIRFACSQCRRTLQVDDRFAGAKIRCPKCRAITAAPAREAESGRGAAASSKADATKKAVRPIVDDDDEPIHFDKPKEDEGIDMTSMLDCVFLLLIFFMVTTAFNVQKSLEIPKPSEDNAAAQAVVVDPMEGNIIVRIDRDNVVFVNDIEAPSEQDLHVKLREAKEGVPGTDSPPINSVLVMADKECLHETVVMALDACNAVDIEKIKLATVSEDDF
ncbi:MAG TPA: biopolymer transporter ExbD [Thermoguttaceae bacterium]|nr:biopolymer transporter ExbD [Thermoguttaceae bacterium]